METNSLKWSLENKLPDDANARKYRLEVEHVSDLVIHKLRLYEEFEYPHPSILGLNVARKSLQEVITKFDQLKSQFEATLKMLDSIAIELEVYKRKNPFPQGPPRPVDRGQEEQLEF